MEFVMPKAAEQSNPECLVEKAGARLGALAQEIDLIERKMDGIRSGPDRMSLETRRTELSDAQRDLENTVEFLTPRTLRGCVVIGSLLQTAGDVMGDSGIDRRRFWRLYSRLMEGLSNLAGASAVDVGMRGYGGTPTPLDPLVREAFACDH
jgi:hypothetical protein